MPKPLAYDEPMTRRNVSIPDHLWSFASATKSAAAYIRTLLEERQAGYAQARVLLESQGYTDADILAVCEVQNGHLYSGVMSDRDEIVYNLEDAPDVIARHASSTTEIAAMSERLLGMSEAEASAFRLVADEFWQGRAL